jgi:hypothetical protein
MAENGKDRDKLKAIIESLDPPPPAPEVTGSAGHTLDDCARELLDWVAFIDPQWKERLDILRLERGWGDKEVAGSLIAYPPITSFTWRSSTTRSSWITGVPSRRAAGPRKMTCLQCGKEFEMKRRWSAGALLESLCARLRLDPEEPRRHS